MATPVKREAQKLYARFLTETQRGRKPKIEEYLRLCPESEAVRLRDALIGIEVSIRCNWSTVAPSSVSRAVQILQKSADRRNAIDYAQALLKEIVARETIVRPDDVLATCLGLSHSTMGLNKKGPTTFHAFARGELAVTSKAKIDRFWLKLKEPQIKALAADVLLKAEIDAIPIDLGQVTRSLSLVVEEAELPDNLEGCLVTDGEIGGILVSTLITNSCRRRYTWAHEIGHFILHKDKRVFNDSQATVNDTSGSMVETEANIFASMLLLPDPLMPPGMIGSKVVFSDADRLAIQFDVSLEACLRRLVRASDWACALIISRDGMVERVVAADMFSGFIPVRSSVKPGTVAERLSAADPGTQRTDEIPAGFWIDGWSTSWDAQLVREETRVLRDGFIYTLLTLLESIG